MWLTAWDIQHYPQQKQHEYSAANQAEGFRSTACLKRERGSNIYSRLCAY
jgi:hypothetical protein